MRNLFLPLALASLLLTACTTPTPSTASTPRGVFGSHSEQHPQVEVQVTDHNGETKILTAHVVNGKLLHQHDILLGTTGVTPASDANTRITAQAAPVVNSRWPHGIIPYTFHPDVPSTVRAQVREAARTFHQHTNIRWVERTSEVFYVQFIADTGCYSYVGRASIFRQPQPVSLGDGECGVTGALHEMAHAAGLYHEQSRPDRDQHVQILWENIPDDWHSQYQTSTRGGAHGAYNYESLMHYPAYFNGKLAIAPRDPRVNPKSLGTATTLTHGDIEGLNSLYP